MSRHFPHTSTYANFENLLHNHCTPANNPFNGQLETLLPNPTPHQHHRKQQQKLHHLKPLQQPIPPTENSAPASSRGDFKTKRFNLKQSKKPRKFGCKMCDKVCNSIHELSVHHQQSHNILYCNVCTSLLTTQPH